MRYPPPDHLGAGHAFVWMDRYLDTTAFGPKYLAQERIAAIVRAALDKGAQLGHYELRAWVIMPNHVHVLLLPKISPIRLMQALKGTSAREANRLLRRTGTRFWQSESYDHWVRDQREFDRIVRYIESNPVNAGLVGKVEEFRWSSGNAEMSLGVARMSACSTME